MKITFIISSVVYFSGKKLSYIKTRSVFSPQERIEQSLKTISSIREMLPEAKIVFIELGQDDASLKLISDKVDEYVYLGNKRIIRLFCDSPFKGLGEAIGLIFAKNVIFGVMTDLYVKVSGRYYLTKDFSISVFSNIKFSFLKKGGTVSTRLFTIPQRLLNLWIRILWASTFFLMLGYSLELVLIKLIPRKRMFYVDRLGVAGYIAPTGEFIQE